MIIMFGWTSIGTAAATSSRTFLGETSLAWCFIVCDVTGSFVIKQFSDDLLGFHLGLEVIQQLGRLHIEAGFVKVEQALHRVCPSQAAVAGREKRVGMTDGMDDEIGRFERVGHSIEGRVEFFDEIQIHAASGAVQRKVKARRAHEVEFGKPMFRTDDPANGEAGWIEFLQATQMRFSRTWLARTIRKANGGPRAVSDGEQTGKLFFRKPAKNNATVRAAFQQTAEGAQDTRDHWIGATRGACKPVCRHRSARGEPAMNQEFEDDKGVVRSCGAGFFSFGFDDLQQHPLGFYIWVARDSNDPAFLLQTNGEAVKNVFPQNSGGALPFVSQPFNRDG